MQPRAMVLSMMACEAVDGNTTAVPTIAALSLKYGERSTLRHLPPAGAWNPNTPIIDPLVSSSFLVISFAMEPNYQGLNPRGLSKTP